MTETAVTLVMWGVGGIVSLLFILVSFYFSRSVKAYDDLADSVNKLQLTLSGLNGIILSIQDKNDTFNESCKHRHLVVDNRLDNHSKRLDDLKERILKLDNRNIN